MARAQEENGKKNYRAFFSKYAMIFVLLLLMIVIGALRPQFFTISNLLNVLVPSLIYGIMALGVTIVIISKGIDLSLGSGAVFSRLVVAGLAQASDATGKNFSGVGSAAGMAAPVR